MISFHYIVIGLSLALLIFLLRKEVGRANRARLTWRIIAVTLMTGALAGLVLPLTYRRHAPPLAAGAQGILLTEGTDADSLRLFMRSAPAGTRNFAGNAQAFSKIHVFGYGLTADQWDALQPLPPVIFHPTPARTGLRSAGWQQQLRPGNILRIQGRLYRATNTPVTLHLVGLGSLLDSAVIGGEVRGPADTRDVGKIGSPADTTGDGKIGSSTNTSGAGKAGVPAEVSWELRTVPAQTGRAIYHLLVLSGTDTLEQESLPVEVLPSLNLKILFLAAAPDFENRFLANWLWTNGYGLAIRTAISRGKFDKAWLNMPQISLDHLDAALLDKFDVVIADAAELQALGAGEAAILRRQVASGGLGLIIKADSSRAWAFYRDLFPLAVLRDSAQRPYIKDRSGTAPLLRDSLSRTLVSKCIYGSGKLVFTTLTRTYTKILSGNGKEYTAFWSRVLGAVSRDDEARPNWHFFPARPRVHEAVRVVLETGESGLPQAQMEESAVYLNQHPSLPFYREGRYWPDSPGWQMARTLQGDSTWWYSWAGSDWQNLHRQERWSATMGYLRERNREPEGAAAMIKPGEADRGKPLPVMIAKGWFYVIFLLCCIFLWVERKI